MAKNLPRVPQLPIQEESKGDLTQIEALRNPQGWTREVILAIETIDTNFTRDQQRRLQNITLFLGISAPYFKHLRKSS